MIKYYENLGDVWKKCEPTLLILEGLVYFCKANTLNTQEKAKGKVSTWNCKLLQKHLIYRNLRVGIEISICFAGKNIPQQS